MSLDLSRVTLLFVETRAHSITKRVIDDCISKCNFGDILIYTDKPDLIPVPGARYEIVPDFINKRDAGAFYYGKAMAKVETDFALMLEWDAGVYNADNWLPEFFNYDYIGAPWPRAISRVDGCEVGNGGFTLMSKRLGHFICEHASEWPVYTDMDVCRTNKRAYLAAGFKWPDPVLASHFAWELGPRNPNHFGYHGAFTWPTVLPKEEVVERVRLMLKSPYLVLKSRQLFNAAPWLAGELSVEENAAYYRTMPPGHQLQPRIPGVMSAQQRAAMQLQQAQRRGLITHQQKAMQTGQKA